MGSAWNEWIPSPSGSELIEHRRCARRPSLPAIVKTDRMLRQLLGSITVSDCLIAHLIPLLYPDRDRRNEGQLLCSRGKTLML